MWQRAKHFEELAGSVAAVDVDTEHFTKHSDADLKADADKKAEENGLGHKIREEPKLKQASEEKEDARQQSYQGREGNVSSAGDGSQAGEAAREYGRSSRISSHHEIARAPKDGKRNKGQQERVETGDDRCAGNFGVAKRLRNVHGRKRKSGHKILWYIGPPKRLQPFKEMKAIEETRCANRGVRHKVLKES